MAEIYAIQCFGSVSIAHRGKSGIFVKYVAQTEEQGRNPVSQVRFLPYNVSNQSHLPPPKHIGLGRESWWVFYREKPAKKPAIYGGDIRGVQEA